MNTFAVHCNSVNHDEFILHSFIFLPREQGKSVSVDSGLLNPTRSGEAFSWLEISNQLFLID